jgi:hypothetical protein
VRQFRAFDREALAADFEVPEHWEITSMAAIGRPDPDGAPPSTDDSPSRQRLSLAEILWVPMDESA